MKEDNVKNGISLLLKDEVRSIAVVGKFGNPVSSTSRSISKKFQERKKWNTIEYRYTDIPETVEENTIVFVHGWFGMWNDDLCSVDKVKIACRSLVRILNTTRNVKLILGMRSDLKQKYHEELDDEVDDRYTSLVHYEINLDSGGDVHKDKEYVRYINNHIKNVCKTSDCDCKHLECEMFRRGKDKVVGIPLKISVIEKYHELIPNYIQNLDILKVMKDHFTALEKDREKKYVYEWIVYICLKGKFSRSYPFDTNVVHGMRFEIEKFSFDENDKELSRYIRMRNSDKLRNVASENVQFVFWHPFIYICAFHYLFHKDPELVMKHCNIDAILQLARPKEFKTSYFEVAADDRWVTLFKERIRSLGKEDMYSQHPLVQEHRKLRKQFEINSGMNFFTIPHHLF